MAALNVEIPADLKKALDHACVDRDVKLKDAIPAAIEFWLAGETGDVQPKGEAGEPSGVPRRYRPYLDKLARILASGDGPAIEAATSNIDLFVDRLRPVKGEVGRK